MEATSGGSLVVATVPPASQLALAPRGDGSLIHDPPRIGSTGRTLYHIYSILGSTAEKHANRVAHSLGMGPHAVTRRIQNYFGDGDERESKLQGLGGTKPKSLEKNCMSLMKYALPSESSMTRLEAFKCLVMLTTRYPGLRRIFLEFLNGASTQTPEEHLSALWECSQETPIAQWVLYRDFAAACLADGDLCLIIEESGPKTLISPGGEGEGLCAIERLLVAVDCGGKFSSRIAIRYLGGILELRSFWAQTGPSYESLVKKILVRTQTILEDLGLDSPDIGAPDITVESDTDGIDILCQALVHGVRSWMAGKSAAGLALEYWYRGTWHVLQLLRWPKAQGLLPSSWSLAMSEELNELFPPLYTVAILDSFLATTPVPQGTPKAPMENEWEDQSDDSSRLSESRVLALLSTDLPNTTVTVSKAAFRPNFRGKPVLTIMMYVDPGNGQGWMVQKEHSELCAFDSKIKADLKKSGVKLTHVVVDGSGIWKDHSPNGLAPRKNTLQKYWKNIFSCNLPAHMQHTLIAFLTKDVPRDVIPDVPRPMERHKEGYMMKSGSGGWLVRYYVLDYGLDESIMTYFDCPGGNGSGLSPWIMHISRNIIIAPGRNPSCQSKGEAGEGKSRYTASAMRSL
ncbi:hypothetical protein MVEN_00190900 [Mycena venus]|uniref:Uncharacterized protein n=1 Tax=Mycena venus TaxID=2733690 RepID=A0A8H7DEK6_9AGAR|nr:hypothetical protein MVEN_00190900 [Mycena venus]